MKIKVLSSTNDPAYATEFIRATIDGKDYRFKIVSENRNSQCNLKVYIVNLDTGLHLIAENKDIPDFKYIDYTLSDNKRMAFNIDNILSAKEWIKTAF